MNLGLKAKLCLFTWLTLVSFGAFASESDTRSEAALKKAAVFWVDTGQWYDTAEPPSGEGTLRTFARRSLNDPETSSFRKASLSAYLSAASAFDELKESTRSMKKALTRKKDHLADRAIVHAIDAVQGAKKPYDQIEAVDSHGPNVEEVQRRLIMALEKNDVVDFFMFGHGGRTQLYDMMSAVPSDLRKKIRLVYSSGCSDYDSVCKVLDKAGKVYVSHHETSCSPIFATRFLQQWISGQSIAKAVEDGNNFSKDVILDIDLPAFCADAVTPTGDRDQAYLQSLAIAAGNEQLTIDSPIAGMGPALENPTARQACEERTAYVTQKAQQQKILTAQTSPAVSTESQKAGPGIGELKREDEKALMGASAGQAR